MMIDVALTTQREGKDPPTAIYDAALLRFRPIMMTTLAALFGVLPIAVGIGAGAELRQPLGVAVVGGLLVSQVLTLYMTPVLLGELHTARGLPTQIGTRSDTTNARKSLRIGSWLIPILWMIIDLLDVNV